jgi:hypothetical protein
MADFGEDLKRRTRVAAILAGLEIQKKAKTRTDILVQSMAAFIAAEFSLRAFLCTCEKMEMPCPFTIEELIAECRKIATEDFMAVEVRMHEDKENGA